MVLLKNAIARMLFNAIDGVLSIRIFLQNSIWLGFAQGIAGLVNFLIAVYLARTFGPTGYGVFAYALSFVMLFSTVFDLGLTLAITKEFSRKRNEEEHLLELIILKLVIGSSALLLILVLIQTVKFDIDTGRMIVLLAIYQCFFQAMNVFYAFFRSRQTMKYESYLRLMQTLILLIFVFSFSFLVHSIIVISYAYAVSAIAAFCLTLALFLKYSSLLTIKRYNSVNEVFNVKIFKKYLKIGFYLALTQGVSDIMMNTDSFLLGFWGLIDEAGLYTAASKVNSLVLFPMSIISTAIFPVLVKSYKNSISEFTRQWVVWGKYTISVAVFITVIISVNAKPIMLFLYSSKFMQASEVLSILMIMAIATYLANLFYQVLLVCSLQKYIFYSQCVTCVVNVALNILLIPKYGYKGASIATLVSQVINIGFYITILKYRSDVQFNNRKLVSTICLSMLSGCFTYILMHGSGISLGSSILVTSLTYISIFSISIYLCDTLSKRCVTNVKG